MGCCPTRLSPREAIAQRVALPATRVRLGCVPDRLGRPAESAKPLAGWPGGQPLDLERLDDGAQRAHQAQAPSEHLLPKNPLHEAIWPKTKAIAGTLRGEKARLLTMVPRPVLVVQEERRHSARAPGAEVVAPAEVRLRPLFTRCPHPPL